MSLDRPREHSASVNGRPYRDDPIQGARVANLRARLERRARDAYANDPPAPELARRIELLEAGLNGVVRLLVRAGIVEIDLVGAVTLRTGRGGLCDRLDEIENLAALAHERADAT